MRILLYTVIYSSVHNTYIISKTFLIYYILKDNKKYVKLSQNGVTS